MLNFRLTNHGFRLPIEPEHQWFVDVTDARAMASQQRLFHFSIYERKIQTNGNTELVEVQHTCRG